MDSRPDEIQATVSSSETIDRWFSSLLLSNILFLHSNDNQWDLNPGLEAHYKSEPSGVNGMEVDS